MRQTIVLHFLATLALAGLSGCASQRCTTCATPPADEAAAAIPIADGADQSFAAALAFDPPVIADELPLDLPRESRERTAFIGFQQQEVTVYGLRIDDRQSLSGVCGWGNWGGLDRRATSVRFGTITR